eukprot:UN21784
MSRTGRCRKTNSMCRTLKSSKLLENQVVNAFYKVTIGQKTYFYLFFKRKFSKI